LTPAVAFLVFFAVILVISVFAETVALTLAFTFLVAISDPFGFGGSR
jgi:accessory gene regulator protein AgrB